MTAHPEPPRVLPLEGGCNFRDFGGYQTQDGRTVRRGLLFRSGVLAHLTDADQQAVQRLGIHTIIDMRREKERVKEPTRWPSASVRIVHHDHAMDAASLNWIVLNQTQSVETAREALISLYQTMPEWLATRLHDLFAALAAGELPLLLHCSAGKDRTGFGSALILEALGVPRATVLADYVLTNQAVDLEAFVLRHHEAGMGLTDAEHPLLSVPPEARKAMLAADPAYLVAALERVDQQHGSASGYISRTLGLGDAVITQLRERLLLP